MSTTVTVTVIATVLTATVMMIATVLTVAVTVIATVLTVTVPAATARQFKSRRRLSRRCGCG
ncbi:MAG: hypothetical protein OXU62_10005 [Gammaproteobacteria bacterium]|nr:hypothetical protein [Gammaproteobacteria bacterium]